MIGSEIRPIEITEAATTPVVAASSAPTKMTANARPPRSGPNTWPMVSSRSSAMPLRSRMSPMKVERHREQRVVRHDRPDTLRERLEERRMQQPQLDSAQSEKDADGGE